VSNQTRDSVLRYGESVSIDRHSPPGVEERGIVQAASVSASYRENHLVGLGKKLPHTAKTQQPCHDSPF
jgi:hypothetical protein